MPYNMGVLRFGLAVLLFTQVCGISLEDRGRQFSKKHEELLSRLSDYRYIRPYRSTSDGEFLSNDLTTDLEEEHIDYTRVKRAHNQRRRKRSIDDGDEYLEDEDELHGSLFHFVLDGMNGEHLMLNVERNRELFSPTVVVNRFLQNGTMIMERPNTRCYYLGHVSHKPNSSVAISNCDGLSGWISTGDEEYIIEPVDPHQPSFISNFTHDGTHIIYRTTDHRRSDEPSLPIPLNLIDRNSLINDTLPRTDGEEEEGVGDEEGPQRAKRAAPRRHTIDSPHFVETMIAADWSMQQYHGSDLTLYLTTMMNIVNKAYAHESLGVNIKFVIARIILLNKDQSSEIVSKDPSQTLRQFCQWAGAENTGDDSSAKHFDYAAFMERHLNEAGYYVGGGFAPVTGMCAITRSCSLNRDEGLLTSFVMAHEAGHVLGMEHDNDQNECSLVDGAIMAPVVTATYSKYFWSRCSKRELLRNLPNLNCLWDTPFNETDDMPFPGIRYSMNDQCRFDFGPGTVTCNGQYNIDPCRNLWCLQPENEPVRTCRSKKGPPLDGSSCGPGMWCIQGRCRDIENRQDGGWSDWEGWSSCTYSCGTGVQTRIRKCDNPRPVNGGRYCEGDGLQYKLCNTKQCKRNRDRRSNQCRDNLGNWVYHGETHTWLPFQNRNKTQQCKLTCMSETTKDVVVSSYNVIDGTPCNYEDKDHICIQGECVKIGCDKDLESTTLSDNCGVCPSNMTRCQRVQGAKKKMPKQAKQYIKIVKIPEGATNIKIEEVKESPYYIALKETANGQYILNGNRKQSKAHDFIHGGARFVYRPDGPETLVTAGPLPVALQLRVYVSGQISLVHVRWSYYENKDVSVQVRSSNGPVIVGSSNVPVVGSSNEPVLDHPITEEIAETPEYPETPEGLVWEATGWTECTETCGGGISYYQYQCRRQRDNQTVHARRCLQSNYDELAISKECNEEECLPELPPPRHEWRTSNWSPCSITCGVAGTKSRTISCYQFRYNDDGTLFEPESEVAVGFCHEEDKPADITDCQGRPCPAEWKTGKWGECSATCGEGTQTRSVKCQRPKGQEPQFKCYYSKPVARRTCDIPACPVVEGVGCVPNSGSVCKPKNYKKFCGVPGYDDFCCATCEEQQAIVEAAKATKGRRGRGNAANRESPITPSSMPVVQEVPAQGVEEHN
ncbi:A disintegrin and metalloproteinase with thrombospondin motifs 3-like isoform X3 [Apostichopus japonicus]|uniref:A disintegrin and metalloproteinase with thrombospondin motifs 3-like isoform X3 n=1 Tax=Stichopus japonicus TaxID=307972 RepID=UPI003AB7B375